MIEPSVEAHGRLDLIDPRVRSTLRAIDACFVVVIGATTIAANTGPDNEWTARGIAGVTVIILVAVTLCTSFVLLGRHLDLAGVLCFAGAVDTMAIAFTLLSPPAHVATATLPLLAFVVLLGVLSTRGLLVSATLSWLLAAALFAWGQAHRDAPPLMTPNASSTIHAIVFATLAALLLAAVVALRNRLTRAIRDLETDVADRSRAQEQLRVTVEGLITAEERQRQLLHDLISAEEGERRRIALGLHDIPVQRLVAALIRLDIGGGNEDKAKELIGESLESLRHMMFDLYPRTLDELGLIAATRELVGQFKGTLPPVEISGELPTEVPPDIQLIAFRILSEAVANVSQHAAASRAGITIEEEGDELAITVIDDGVGIDEHIARDGIPGHYGLPTMLERSRLAGGQAWITSTPGHGTTLQVRLPLRPSPLPGVGPEGTQVL